MDVRERARLIARLRKVESLYRRPGTPGERRAAEEALARLRARLGTEGPDPFEFRPPPEREVEYRFSIHDPWKRKLFFALLSRHGLVPWRYPRQRRSSIMVRVRASFVDRTLWPEFRRLSRMLERELESATEAVIARAGP